MQRKLRRDNSPNRNDTLITKGFTHEDLKGTIEVSKIIRDRVADAKQSTLTRKQHIHKKLEKFDFNVTRSIDNILSDRFIKRRI